MNIEAIQPEFCELDRVGKQPFDSHLNDDLVCFDLDELDKTCQQEKEAK